MNLNINLKKPIIICSLITCVLIVFSTSVVSKEITSTSFNGTWCGKWDNVYEFCIIISDLEKTAKYQWKEHPNGKFKKANKELIRKNLNTLQLENIWLVLNEADLEQANALGVFKIRSRTATLRKLKTVAL